MKAVKPPVWTLESALELIESLEPYLECSGWHVALAGSVLRRGKSWKDLDLVCFPNKGNFCDVDDLRHAMHQAGLVQVRTRDEIRDLWHGDGRLNIDSKHVEIWMKGSRRVDLIVWPPESPPHYYDWPAQEPADED